jgi:hypothetical protein
VKCSDVNLINKFKEISTRTKNDSGMEMLCREIAKYLEVGTEIPSRNN